MDDKSNQQYLDEQQNDYDAEILAAVNDYYVREKEEDEYREPLGPPKMSLENAEKIAAAIRPDLVENIDRVVRYYADLMRQYPEANDIREEARNEIHFATNDLRAVEWELMYPDDPFWTE